MAGGVSDRRVGVGDRQVSLPRGDFGWLLAAVCAAGVIHLAYLATHSHPAYEGGLYLEIAEQIRAHGYALPRTVPGYTADGVPLAYPPLAFYALAVLFAVTGVDPTALMLVLPGLLVAAYLVPYYYLARELLASRHLAGTATLLFAAAPPVLRWHLSAGGVVRSGAVLLALTGAYTGVRLFRDGGRRWLAASVVLFGLTVLTHPQYTAFFGVTYLVLFAAFDRTPRGLVRGAFVAAGGVALASPWWLHVGAIHGPDVFLAASGTHHGLLGGLGRPRRLFVAPVLDLDAVTPFYLALGAGLVYGLARRRYLLVALTVVPGYVVGKHRFLFVGGAMLVALLAWEGLAPAVRRRASAPGLRRVAPRAVVAMLVVLAAGIGSLFAASALHAAHEHSATMPQTVDAADRDAMAWAQENTDPSAEFLVVGDAAEWFPRYADRTTVVSPWGHEWTSTERYYEEVGLFRTTSTCTRSWCFTATMAGTDRSPEYVYLPKGEYTVRGKEYRQDGVVYESLTASRDYRLAYENDGVAVFEVTGDPEHRLAQAREPPLTGAAAAWNATDADPR